MNIKVTRSSRTSTTLFDASEATALALMRNHVRAIDNTDDDLLKVYLDAALDYMQSITNRLLGSHTVEVLVDHDELKSRIELVGINEIASPGMTAKYRKADGTYSGDLLDSHSADYISDLDYLIIDDIYPAYIYFDNLLDKVSDTDTKFTKGYLKLEMTAGTALASLPSQYKQAALLLVGHYYNMREAEAIGGITMELKEGVQRLMSSARLY